MLSRLLYMSNVNPLVGPEELREILRRSRECNSVLGVTGLLSVCKRRFLQALEGERQVVNDLYMRITTDPRHDSCCMLEFKEIETRSFEHWSMHLVDLDNSSDPSRRIALQRYYIGTADEPFSLPAIEATALLLALQDLTALDTAA